MKESMGVKGLFQMTLLFTGVCSVVISTIGYIFVAYNDVLGAFDRLERVEKVINTISNSSPNAVDFLGNGVASSAFVQQGSSISIVYTLRRNINCETRVVVRFWSHDDNVIASKYTYEIPSVRSAVTNDFQAFVLRVRIPEDMTPGKYSYFPDLIPLSCGVYKPQIVPMSTSFIVEEKSQ